MSSYDIPLTQLVWHKESHEFPDLSKDMESWLFDKGSLTQRIIKLCQLKDDKTFNVDVLRQETLTPETQEIELLGMQKQEQSVIREVLLYCGDKPIVFARTVIPKSTLTGKQEQLNNLGNKPLGEFLFTQDNMYRTPIEISSYQFSDQKISSKQENKTQLDNMKQCWVRRSVFYLDDKPLLVYEAFLSPMKAL